MAQVDQSLTRRIDDWLDYLLDAWRELPEIERQIDSWDLIEQIDYVEEWGPKESLLASLRHDASLGKMNRDQQSRFTELEGLVERNRSILERLRAS